MLKEAERHIKKAVILLLLLPLLSVRLSAQYSIEYTYPALTKTYDSGVNWVDIDGDGDLDLTISGYTPFIREGQGELYLNNYDVIEYKYKIEYKKDIRAIALGDQKWCDIDHDSIPDLIYAGDTLLYPSSPAGMPSAGIDTFDLSLNYARYPVGFTPVLNASIDWGDYDNDGDYDILISGEDGSGYITTKLYSNNKGSFSAVSTNIPGIMYGKVGFIDYDLDQDLDILITGRDINENKYTRLWKNTGGSYNITNDLFINLQLSSFDWGDFNGDGYPDLLLGGYNNTSGSGYLYINNSGNSFSLSNIKVPKFQKGTPGFGDVDNDGDLDAFVSGSKVSPLIANKYIFINNQTDSLIPTTFTSENDAKSFFNFGDYDNDDDLDFVTNGTKATGGAGLTIIAKNTTLTPNQKPSVPGNLTAIVEGTTVRLSWNHSTDNNTPPKSITYNIYMGTVSEGIDIVTPNASVATGFRKIARQGYIQDTAWTIKNLPVGTYHWGVQAIDNSLGASDFSEESSFEIKERFTVIPYSESPNNTSPATFFDCDHDKDLDMVLNCLSSFQVAENSSNQFSQANYRTILANGYNPIYTLTPNDYDNDNLIDFSVSGNYTVNGLLDSTIALFGYNGPFNYSIIDSALVKDINYEYAIWSDFNNDGRQDLITSGKTTNLATNKPITVIYQNKGSGVFQKVSHSIRGFEKTGAVTGDFDNDMDIDILIYGKDSLGVPNTYIYINEGNFTFTENLVPNNELYREYLRYGTVAGDYNLDGQLDVYFGGVDLLNDNYARVLLNDNMNFTDANLQLRSAPKMSNFWADYDYDGDLDIYSVTSFQSPDKTRLYLNNNGILQETIIDLGDQHKMDMPFMAVNIDNKNGLDFLMKINGKDYNQYFDNWGSDERISTAPGNLRFEQDQLDIILMWDKLPDCPACTYNIRIGTVSNGFDIMSPMADITTGYRYVVQPGNAYLNDSWKLCDLPVGDYFWSVQAVDPSNTGGPWSPPSTITVSHIDADFSFTTVCRGDTTEFSDLSVGTDPVTKWKWSFGDGTSGSLKNPKHLYSAAGTFTAGLWAYSEAGDSAYQSYNVTVKAVPVADFSTNIACQGTPTTFTNNTNINGLTILSWFWNFGDGQTSNLEEPGTHGYINPAEYLADLMVTADNGCSDFITQTVTVGSNPVAAVTANAPLTFCKGDSVTLSVPYSNSYTYNWMAGGTSLTGGDSSRYVARLTGNYSVEVVNTTGNCRDTSSIVVVTAQDAPVAPLITANGVIIFCDGDSVVLSVTNISGYTYQWKLNGGATGGNSNKYTAKSSGTYDIVVSNANGCSVSSVNSVDVTVNPAPTAGNISLDGRETFCEGGSVTLSVPATTGYTYHWKNESGLITGAEASSYTVTTTGTYQLEVTNQSECKSMTSPVGITVNPAPDKPVLTSENYTEGVCPGVDPIKLTVSNIVPGNSYTWIKNGELRYNDTLPYIEFYDKGTYKLRAELGACSIESEAVTITLPDAPEKPVVYVRGPVVWYMAASSNTADRYQWYRNGEQIPGATRYIYVANKTLGTYKVAVGNENECFTMSDEITIPVAKSQMTDFNIPKEYLVGQDMGLSESIQLYPNPTTGVFTVEMENNMAGEIFISIITEQGKEIRNIKTEKTTEHFLYNIDLSNQAKGLYIINLLVEKFSTTRKVIIE